MQQGNEVAEGIIRYLPNLKRYARSLTHETQAANDLVQDCVVSALRGSYQWEQGTNLLAWLLAILHNNWVNDGRRIKRLANYRASPAATERVASMWSRTASPEAYAITFEVVRALEHLPGPQRDVVQKVVIDEVSYRDAARDLGVPEGTVRSRLSRARESLRRAVDR